jgi:hypothetical protein
MQLSITAQEPTTDVAPNVLESGLQAEYKCVVAAAEMMAVA